MSFPLKNLKRKMLSFVVKGIRQEFQSMCVHWKMGEAARGDEGLNV